MDGPARGNSMKAGKLATLASPTTGRYHACMNSTSCDSRKGITWFVSRHPGAIEWAKRQGLAIDQWVDHLDPAAIEAGDTVIGTLPVNLAAEVCERDARYLHLSLRVPAEWRGHELSANDLQRLAAQLKPFSIKHLTQAISRERP